MGFGFALFAIFILIPLTVVLLSAWLWQGSPLWGLLLKITWLCLIGLMLFSWASRWLTAPKVLEKEDYYGTYVVDRSRFPGLQADWQYDHFRFEITEQDSLFFYVTDRTSVLKVYRGSIRTVSPSGSARLILEAGQPVHHILASTPTTYRSAWGFYLVFRSPKFGNVFFKKGKWQPEQ